MGLGALDIIIPVTANWILLNIEPAAKIPSQEHLSHISHISETITQVGKVMDAVEVDLGVGEARGGEELIEVGRVVGVEVDAVRIAGGEGSTVTDDGDWHVIDVCVGTGVRGFTRDEGIGDTIRGNDAGVDAHEDLVAGSHGIVTDGLQIDHGATAQTGPNGVADGVWLTGHVVDLQTGGLRCQEEAGEEENEYFRCSH